MAKGKLFFSLIFGILVLSSLVSADYFERESVNKDYTNNFEKITYIEDLKGKYKGFSLTISSNSPKYEYEYENDYPYITFGNINTRDRSGPRYSWENRDYSGYGNQYYDSYNSGSNSNLEQVLLTYRLGRDRKYFKSGGYDRYGNRYDVYNRYDRYSNYGYPYSSYGSYGGYSGYGSYGGYRSYW